VTLRDDNDVYVVSVALKSVFGVLRFISWSSQSHSPTTVDFAHDGQWCAF
jgi:hypothetical protein